METRKPSFYRVLTPDVPYERPVSECLTQADADRLERRFLTAYPEARVWSEKVDESGGAIRGSGDARPRGSCPTCNQSFSPATDRQWQQRWNYHLLFSERHKKYVAALANASQAQIVQHHLYR